jgi:hypothetical protein
LGSGACLLLSGGLFDIVGGLCSNIARAFVGAFALVFVGTFCAVGKTGVTALLEITLRRTAE